MKRVNVSQDNGHSVGMLTESFATCVKFEKKKKFMDDISYVVGQIFI